MVNWLLFHRRSVLFFLALLVLGGAAAALRLPVALFPHIEFPRIVVAVEAGDRSVERMVVEVTQPLEQALRGVPEAGSLRSTSSRGSADLSLNFAWGTDMVTALLQVNSAITQVLPTLPPGTSFRARRMDPTVFPVVGFALTSKVQDQIALRDLAFYEIRPVLSAVSGVAQVQVVGGQYAEYQVLVDPARLQAVGLTRADVVQALSATNVLRVVGRLEDDYHLYLVLSDSRLHGIEEIEHTILQNSANGVVELEDVAEVRLGERPQWTRVTANGTDAVLIDVLQQRGANTVAIVNDTRAALALMASKIPPGVQIKPYYDQSELVTAAAVSVRDAILIAAGLAAVILLLFLRDLRFTLISALVLPGVLAASVLLLYALHMSFNIMTLGGMAAAVGLVVDDTVVMLEHMMRRLGESRADPSEYSPVLTASTEMRGPLMGSSLATIIVFLPLAFLGGVTGGFLKSLALTMSACLIISFFVALLAVPLVADRLTRNRTVTYQEAAGSSMIRLHRLYDGFMTRFLSHPLWLLPAVLVLSLIGYVAYTQVGTGFMPRMDEGGFILDYRTPPGTSLIETDRVLRQVEILITGMPEVDSYSRRTGLQLGGSLTEANQGDFFIHLKPLPRRNCEVVMADLRGKIETEVPGLRIETLQLMEDLIGDLTAVPQPIEVKLFGNDSAALRQLASQVAARLKTVPGVVEVFDGITIAGDAIEVRIDRIKAALEGLDPDAVTLQIQNQVEGNVASQIQVGAKMVGVRVWTPADTRDRIALLPELRIRAPDGHYLPLKRVAEVSVSAGQAQVVRENLKEMVAVTGRIEGRDLGSTMQDVQAAMDALTLPGTVSIQYGGLYREQQQSFRGLMVVFVSAMLLIMATLLFIYERLAVVLSILLTILLAMSGVFLGLWITGTELNISSMMGLTMIVGIATEVAIFYFAELALGPSLAPSALINAGQMRMRPIFMTSLVAVLALMPLALGIGAGSAMQKPLAIAIISGLIVAVPLVLLLMPTLFLWLHRMFGGEREAQ